MAFMVGSMDGAGNVPMSMDGLTGTVFMERGVRIERSGYGAGATIVAYADHIVAKAAITGGGDTVTLPPSSGRGGQTYIIKDESGTAGTNNITINTTGGLE